MQASKLVQAVWKQTARHCHGQVKIAHKVSHLVCSCFMRQSHGCQFFSTVRRLCTPSHIRTTSSITICAQKCNHACSTHIRCIFGYIGGGSRAGRTDPDTRVLSMFEDKHNCVHLMSQRALWICFETSSEALPGQQVTCRT